MPRKKKTSGKEIRKKEEILKEIAESIKKISETDEAGENINESELEGDIDTGLRDLGFQDFTGSFEVGAKAPVLERIAGSQAGPIFVGMIPQGATGFNENESGEKDALKYVPGQNVTNEPKYIGSDSHITAETRRIDFTDVGRRTEILPEVNQQAFFERASEIRQMGMESPPVEKFERAERFDTTKAGRKEPFEREEVKYEKYKPKLPKSW